MSKDYPRQYQTTFGGPSAEPAERGNCYATCIAMLLGIDVSRVPNFVSHADYFGVAQRWLAERGVLLLCFDHDPIPYVPEWRERVIMIAGGPSPRGYQHSVLWRDGKLFLDPHPSGAGLVGDPNTYEVLVIADPTGFRRWLRDATEAPIVRNMYGCLPCPNCGGKYRYGITGRPGTIYCDDCGHEEPGEPVWEKDEDE